MTTPRTGRTVSEDFYCDEALTGRTPVVREYGGCRVLTNLGIYQDSKHLHFHVNAGDPLDSSGELGLPS